MGTRGRFPAKPEKARFVSIKMPQRYRGPKHTRISERPALFFLRYFVLAVVVHAGLGVGVCADPEYNIRFQQISIEAGLSQSSIDCLLLDSRGFMWFGTQDGLNRYDGYRFEIYKHDPADPDTLSNSYILSIYEDSSGTIWIGTESGLNSYQRSTNGFSRSGMPRCTLAVARAGWRNRKSQSVCNKLCTRALRKSCIGSTLIQL